MSVDDLLTFFSKGRIATVRFIKNDGEPRLLNGKVEVDKNINGKGASYNARERGQLRVFDLHVKNSEGERVGGWRTVTANKVTDVFANKMHYVIG